MIKTRQVFDGKGNLLGEEPYEMPDEVMALEQAQARLRELKARGKATWTTADLRDISEALLQLMGA